MNHDPCRRGAEASLALLANPYSLNDKGARGPLSQRTDDGVFHRHRSWVLRQRRIITKKGSLFVVCTNGSSDRARSTEKSQHEVDETDI